MQTQTSVGTNNGKFSFCTFSKKKSISDLLLTHMTCVLMDFFIYFTFFAKFLSELATRKKCANFYLSRRRRCVKKLINN